MFDATRSAVLAASLLVLLTASHASAQDSGFLRGQGKLDLAISFGLDTYDEFWIGSTKVSNPPFGRVTRQYATVYGAYGLTDEIDLSFNVAYVYASSDSMFDDESALQDLTVQLKARLASMQLGPGTLNLLINPGLKVPLTHYEDNSVTAIGDGNVDIRVRGIVQYVFDNGVYIALESGYDVRFDSPPDEVPLNLNAGVTLWENVTISGFLSWINSLGGHDIGEGSFPGVEEEYVRVGGNLYWRLTDNLGFSGSGWTTLDGKNTGDVDGFSVGLVLHF